MGRVEQQAKDNYNSLSHEGEKLRKEAEWKSESLRKQAAWEAEKLKENAKLDASDMKRDLDESAHSSWETVKEGANSVKDYISSGIDSVKNTFSDPEERAMENLKQNVNEKLDEAEKEGSSILGGISNFFRGTTEEAQRESEHIANEAYKAGDQFVGDVHSTGEKYAHDSKKEATKLSNEIKKDAGKLSDDLKKDTAKFADETKKIASDIKNKASDTYSDLTKDASKAVNGIKKKGIETLDESADAIENQYSAFKKDFDHLNKRNGAIWASIGMVGGAGASSFFFPTASPMAKFTLIAGLASLGGYYGLHQPHNKIVDDAFNKAHNKKEEIKKKL